MPKQPFLPRFKGKSATVAPNWIDNMPDLAQLIGRIAIHWTGVDVQLSLLLGTLLGVHNSTSVAVFHSLRNNVAKRDVLVAAAKESLNPSLMPIFDAFIAFHAYLDKQRNDAVHGLWGSTEATTDGIVWCSSRQFAVDLMTDYYRAANKTFDHKSRPAEKLEHYFTVQKSDLETLILDMTGAQQAISRLHYYLRFEGVAPGPESYTILVAWPEIQTIVDWFNNR